MQSRIRNCITCVIPLETPSVTGKLKAYFKGRVEGEDGHWEKRVERRMTADKEQLAAFTIIQGYR